MFDLHRGAGAVGIFGVVEEGEEFVILPVCNRIELVRVALGATHREAKPNRSGGVDAVDDRLHAELLAVRSAFLVNEGVPVKGRGNKLGLGAFGKEVTGQLFDRELIEGKIVVECFDDPVAVRPHVATAIDRVAVGISVASLVKPVPTPTLAIVRACKESVYKASPCVGTFIGDEVVSFFGRRQEAGEIERESSDESGSIGGG